MDRSAAAVPEERGRRPSREHDARVRATLADHGSRLYDADAMKYFTMEMWRAFNKDFRKDAPADRLWKANGRRYRRQLARILPRLSKRAAPFFTRHGLHDGMLLRFSTGDAVEHALPTYPSFRGRPRTPVVLTVAEGYSHRMYTLRYDDVQSIDLRAEVIAWDKGDSLFGDWGYDELTAQGAEHLRHSILFSTGTELSIVFRRFAFRTERIRR